MADRATLIERAARAIYEHVEAAARPEDRVPWGQAERHWHDVYTAEATAALDALVPPGEAWIAPWERTEAIDDVLRLDSREESLDRAEMWGNLRDAFLSEQDKGT